MKKIYWEITSLQRLIDIRIMIILYALLGILDVKNLLIDYYSFIKSIESSLCNNLKRGRYRFLALPTKKKTKQ